MNNIKLEDISKLIDEKKIDLAQIELSKLGSDFYKNSEYLYLRGKIFYINKLYYIAIDTLLIALEFKKDDKIYKLIAKIYKILENIELSNRITDSNSRVKAIKSLKSELSGIYEK